MQNHQPIVKLQYICSIAKTKRLVGVSWRWLWTTKNSWPQAPQPAVLVGVTPVTVAIGPVTFFTTPTPSGPLLP